MTYTYTQQADAIKEAIKRYEHEVALITDLSAGSVGFTEILEERKGQLACLRCACTTMIAMSHEQREVVESRVRGMDTSPWLPVLPSCYDDPMLNQFFEFRKRKI